MATLGRATSAVDDGVSVLTSIHDVNANQWNNLVVQSERGSMFHRYEWLAAIEAGFDYEPYHTVEMTGGNPTALMPNFISPIQLPDDVVDSFVQRVGHSLLNTVDGSGRPAAPAVRNSLSKLRLPSGVASSLVERVGLAAISSTIPGYGGPLAGANEHESVGRLLDAVGTTTRRPILYHLVRTYDLEYIRYGKYLLERGYEPKSNVCLFCIDLEGGWERVFERMDKGRRWSIRQAHEQDFHVEVTSISEDTDRTYESYAANMERVGGKTFPRAFFDALGEWTDDRVRVFTAVVDGQEVGRYVHLLDQENSVLHHWQSAIPDESCFESYPSELLHTRAIEWGIEHGFDEYNLGMTGAHFDNSVFRFKQKYGGRAVPLLQWQKGEARLLWPLFKLGRSMYSKR